ncbi:MAG: TonB-dependent siderophore receptor [Nitrosomonas sp.]|nr:TonB-dependent siderophore receptor [Nitrosomonas sp.]
MGKIPVLKKLILCLGSLIFILPAQAQQVNESKTEKSGETENQHAPANQAAADQLNTTVLPSMVIKGVATSGYVTNKSSVSTKTDTPLIEVPQSISVVTRNELDARGVQDMSEALRYVPGVVVDQWGFEGRGYEYLLLRGFQGLTTSLFRDGLSMAGQGLYFNSFITETYGLERIDVLRGPASVTFGRGDAGGIVNRVTKRPSPIPIREIEFQYGNFDRKRIAADLGAVSKDGNLMFRLVTLGLDSDTQVKYPNTGGDRAGLRRFYIAPSVTWRPTVDTTVTLMGEILNNRAEASPFYLNAPDGSRTNVVQTDSKFVKYATNQSSFSYQLEHHFNEIFTARQNFRYMQQDGDFNDMFRAGFSTEQPTLMQRTAISTKERLTQTVLDSHIQAKVNTGPLQHTILAGVDWNVTHASLRFFSGDAPGIDVFNPRFGIPIPKPSSLDSDAKQRIDQLGGYIQDQIRYGENWILTLSGRYDRIHTRDTDRLTDSRTLNKDDAFTGRAGLTYLFSNGIAPYASYSQSFLPIPGFDSSDKAFKPTRGEQFEVGVKYQPLNGRSLYSVAFFDLTKTNVPTPDPNDPQFRSRQTGEIGSRGVEVEARAELLPGLNMIGTFTYHGVTVTKSTDIDDGKMPIQVPNVMASGWLDYSFGNLGVPDWMKGFGIGGGVRYVGRIFNDLENTSTTASYTLFDAMLRYDYGPWIFIMNASNIFNNNYLSYNDPGWRAYPGLERTVLGTLKFRF